MLDEMIQRSGSYGTKEVVIGMAHRGPPDVLVNTFGKNPRELFDEFEGKKKVELGSGDVKYHQGFSSNVMTTGWRSSPGHGVQPVPPGNRFSSGRGFGARPSGPSQRLRTVTRYCRSRSTATLHSPVRAWS